MSAIWRKYLPVLSFLPLIASLACNSPTSPEEETPEPIPLDGRGGGIIAYSYQPASGNEIHRIYAINADGTGNKPLGSASIGLNHHDWSPDGQRLALVGYLNNFTTWSIHVMNSDGSGLTRLTFQENVSDSEPAWSPDGTQIAFSRIYEAENRSDLWLMNADGSNQRKLGPAGFAAKWSTDATRFIYCVGPILSGTTGNAELFTCRTDGTDVRQLTFTTSIAEYFPSWSPDGSKILFSARDVGAENYKIYVMNADGSDRRCLTDSAARSFTPRWSPDGSLIAFGSDLSSTGHWEIHIMNADGTNVRRVTTTPGTSTAICPAWRPGY